uniref:Similar to eukaryotic Peptidyl prolyl 4-hydroxylase, alpha subunit n=1 Tax=Rheinheimera sp. BAL341 TaxID=1708203 RepID=A0A486XPG3_9GAMM
MNTQDLIRQALVCFNQNQRAQGKALMLSAAQAGSVAAVLYYADLLFKEDKAAAYSYLAEQWQQGIAGTLHRRALLRCFFDTDGSHSAAELFDDLHQEAVNGDLQSVIALLSVLGDNTNSEFYRILLQQFSPQLSGQLLAGQNATGELMQQPLPSLPDLEALRQSFASGLQQWQLFHCTDLNTEIGLVCATAALTELECNYMMLRFGTLLQPSLIVDPHTGAATQNPYRTGSMVAIGPEYLDWVTLAIEYKMSFFAGFARQQGEVMNLIHYDKQQRYLPHFDAIVGDSASLAAQLPNGGQRQLTVLAYLNTVTAGGETSFPKLGIKVQARAGDLLMFRNIDAAGKVLQASYHAGEPVLAGDKWLLSKWVRQGVTDYGTLTYS